jgi:energy-coupling factor transporter ATP-binding protein EcfA2
MTSSTSADVKTGNVLTQDTEVELVNRLAAATTQAGFEADRIDVANFYVALKYKPMAILAGSAGSGKTALVKSLAGILTGDGLHGQVMPGHAWYAGSGVVNTILIGMHTRLITEKVLFMIEEALLPENARLMFVVGLIHLSPAELLSFFTEVAYQVQHNRIMRIGDTHLSAPVPFPSNLLLIGTMDTTEFERWDEQLLSGTTIIEWHSDRIVPEYAAAGELQISKGEFLHSSLRNSWEAYKKLLSVVAGIKQPLKAVMLVQDIFQAHGLEFSPALLDGVILYLANSWSLRGNGLFDPSASRNLAIASDLALAQLVLPPSLKVIRSSETMQEELCSVLDGQLPRSGAFLKRLSEDTLV